MLLVDGRTDDVFVFERRFVFLAERLQVREQVGDGDNAGRNVQRLFALPMRSRTQEK